MSVAITGRARDQGGEHERDMNAGTCAIRAEE